MRRSARWGVAACVLVSTAAGLWASGCGEGAAGGGLAAQGAGGQAAASQPLPATARFQAVIYETHLPSERVGQLDAKDLAAKRPEAFAKALTALGATKALYQVDQSVELAEARISIGSRVPIVMNTRATAAGPTLRTVQYEDVGAIFDIRGRLAGGKQIQLQMEVDLAASDSGVEVGAGAAAPAFRKARLSYVGPVEQGRAFVALAVDSAAKDKDGNAVAFVCRAVLSDVRGKRAEPLF